MTRDWFYLIIHFSGYSRSADLWIRLMILAQWHFPEQILQLTTLLFFSGIFGQSKYSTNIDHLFHQLMPLRIYLEPCPCYKNRKYQTGSDSYLNSFSFKAPILDNFQKKMKFQILGVLVYVRIVKFLVNASGGDSGEGYFRSLFANPLCILTQLIIYSEPKAKKRQILPNMHSVIGSS